MRINNNNSRQSETSSKLNNGLTVINSTSRYVKHFYGHNVAIAHSHNTLHIQPKQNDNINMFV